MLIIFYPVLNIVYLVPLLSETILLMYCLRMKGRTSPSQCVYWRLCWR